MLKSLGAFTYPIIVVVIIASLGFSSWMAPIVLKQTIPEPSSGPCTLAYPSAGPYPSVPVLVLQSGATGDLCVTYINSLGNEISSQVYAGVYGPTNDSARGLITAVPSLVSITPDPNTIAFSQGHTKESTTVVFRITVASNATEGIYGLFLFQICDLQPFVVGGARLGLIAADFPWYPHEGSCPAQVMSAQIVGVSGFDLINVT